MNMNTRKLVLYIKASTELHTDNLLTEFNYIEIVYNCNQMLLSAEWHIHIQYFILYSERISVEQKIKFSPISSTIAAPHLPAIPPPHLCGIYLFDVHVLSTSDWIVVATSSSLLRQFSLLRHQKSEFEKWNVVY